MDPQRIDEILFHRAEPEPGELPSGFARSVLRKAREIRELAKRHRRWLVISTCLAIFLAGLVSFRLGRDPATIPPPLQPLADPAFLDPGVSP